MNWNFLMTLDLLKLTWHQIKAVELSISFPKFPKSSNSEFGAKSYRRFTEERSMTGLWPARSVSTCKSSQEHSVSVFCKQKWPDAVVSPVGDNLMRRVSKIGLWMFSVRFFAATCTSGPVDDLRVRSIEGCESMQELTIGATTCASGHSWPVHPVSSQNDYFVSNRHFFIGAYK
jgi:hypothetical protein